MAPYLNIFGVTVQAFGLLLLLALWAGLWLSARQARRFDLDGDRIYNLGLYALLAPLVAVWLSSLLPSPTPEVEPRNSFTI